MKAEDASHLLPEIVTAEPVSPAEATEARVPYLTGTQDADPSRKRESDPIAALTDLSLDDGFLSHAAAPLSPVAAPRVKASGVCSRSAVSASAFRLFTGIMPRGGRMRKPNASAGSFWTICLTPFVRPSLIPPDSGPAWIWAFSAAVWGGTAT